MSEKSYYIPKHLDDPPKLFWWDADEVIIFSVIMFPGLILKIFPIFILFVMIAAVGTLEYTKIKAGKLKGYLLHFAYWLGIIKLKKLPESYIRYLNG